MNAISLTPPELTTAVRILEIEDTPWFVAKDVLTVLEIDQPTNQAVAKLDDDEVTQAYLTDALGRSQKTYLVSESGLYALILRSDKPAARKFRKWITAEVLPALRRDGFYAAHLAPAARMEYAAQCGQRAAALRLQYRQAQYKAGCIQRLPDSIPDAVCIFDWVCAAFPALGVRQRANMTRLVKRELISRGLPVSISIRHRRQVTARQEDLAALEPAALLPRVSRSA